MPILASPRFWDPCAIGCDEPQSLPRRLGRLNCKPFNVYWASYVVAGSTIKGYLDRAGCVCYQGLVVGLLFEHCTL